MSESVTHIEQVTRYEVTCDDHGLIGQYENEHEAKMARSGHLVHRHNRAVALARAKKAADR